MSLIATPETLRNEFSAFDSLPPELRRVLWDEGPYDAREVMADLNKLLKKGVSHRRAIERIAYVLRKSSEFDVRSLSYWHERHYGAPTPHVAAGATFLRNANTPPRRSAKKQRRAAA
jgi:hypothetical protein